MPRNARIRNGARFYTWAPEGQEPVTVLSVTSIRRILGLPEALVGWQIANIVRLAMGARKQTRIGPRGGVSEVLVQDGPFPGEFVRRILAAEGNEAELKAVSAWLRSAGDEPRDVAAVRGSVTHKLIEQNIPMSMLDEALITRYFEDQWGRERRKVKVAVTEDDLNFVFNNMRQYWYMRSQRPYVILAAEPQVWNLTAGYAGQADALLWFLPEGTPLEDVQAYQKAAGRIQAADIERIGGEVVLGDYKTATDVHTDNVVQVTAYNAAEFIGADGEVDERLTAILALSRRALILHVRPDGVELDFVPWSEATVRAFLGQVMNARFLATYPEPSALFDIHESYKAPDTDPSMETDDDDE